MVSETRCQSREGAASPVWSPDGSQIAYVGLRAGRFSVYRKAANGEGNEELVYESNTPIALSGWSMDGRFLTYAFSDLTGGALYALPLEPGRRTPIEIFRSKSQLGGGLLSPDSRLVSYRSDESGRMELYVRRFDAANPAAAAAEPARRISDQGTRALGTWRRDGKELYYVSGDQGLMAVGVGTTPTAPFGKPRPLFRVPEAMPIFPGLLKISFDGEVRTEALQNGCTPGALLGGALGVRRCTANTGDDREFNFSEYFCELAHRDAARRVPITQRTGFGRLNPGR